VRLALSDDQPGAVVVTNIDDSGAQKQLDGHPEGVEATSEIGDRSGNDDLFVQSQAVRVK
jgi:hypothetical protein